MDEEKIKKIILESGYLEEQKVAIEFDKNGFYAGANYAFEDQDTGKSREIDLIATKYSDFQFGKTGFYFYVYAEVKKRKNPLIFFERKPEIHQNYVGMIPVVATHPFFSYIDQFLDISKYLNFEALHHQCSLKYISTQFCEISYKDKAEHSNIYESIILPLLKCIISEINDIQNRTSVFNPLDPVYFLSIFLPVVIVSGPLYGYDVNLDKLERKKHIIYRRHYSSKNISKSFLIDIVDKSHLKEYLSEKLLKTYTNIEKMMKSNIDDIISKSLKDLEMQKQKIGQLVAKKR